MRIGFIPDRRNLGGKKDIDNLQKNHLLALINAKSLTHNKVAPFKPIAHQKKSRQKSLGQIQIEFREVYESQKRVLNLKKGGIDNTQPVCFDRKNFIKNRACLAKDIQTQDHQRNIISLSKKLNGIQQKSEQNKQKMKEEQMKYQSLSSKFHSRHDHSLFQNSDAYSILRGRPQSASTNSSVKGFKHSLKQSIDYSQIEVQDILVPVNYAYKNKSYADLNQKKNQSHLVSMDYSEMLISENQTNLNSQNSKNNKENNNHKKSYIDSKEDFLISGAPNAKKEVNFYAYENQPDEEEVEYLYQKNKSENSIQLFEGQQLIQSENNSHKNSYHNSLPINQNNQVTAQNQQPKPIQQSIPFITVMENNDPYTELRRSLLNVIMDYKLYDKEQMMDLANMVKKKNPHLDLKQIQGVCRNIVIRLYGEL